MTRVWGIWSLQRSIVYRPKQSIMARVLCACMKIVKIAERPSFSTNFTVSWVLGMGIKMEFRPGV